METARHFIAVLLIVSMPPAVVWWILVHPFIGFWRRLGPRTSMTVVAILMIGSAMGLVTVRRFLVGSSLGTQWPLVAVGAVLAVGAVVMGLRRRKYLTTRILAGMPELENDAGTLLTQGPYSVIRHPRYVEVVLAVFAYAAFANYTGAWWVAAATVPALHGVVLLEERELLARFGEEYRSYANRVPRYIPRLGGGDPVT